MLSHVEAHVQVSPTQASHSWALTTVGPLAKKMRDDEVLGGSCEGNRSPATS